ncbi:acyl transferase [Flavobacteriaceae bacterium Ap0902]|nr:acyl transferase [Flavobacteriaceae bacterium Ap0902]
MNIPAIQFKNYTNTQFESKALEIFRYQTSHNTVYKTFMSHLGIDITSVKSLLDIPFLPIGFFKDFEVVSSQNPIEKTFTSSGTTGTTPSKHLITDLNLYHQQLKASFKHFYGDFQNHIIFPLLPAYAERSGSSLIDMVDFWMTETGQENKTYYLYNHAQLAQDLSKAKQGNKQVILIGVSFALLDFAANFPMELEGITIIETGGMKGRKKEITRLELHSILSEAFNTQPIQSEYGMTELLSQAYAQEKGLFQTPPWMQILIRDPEDPFNYVPHGKSGGINVIDLANVNSCAFIATDDLGRFHAENQLEILGRFDNSDVRGCNLMVV